jgi:hypothetical protein
LKKRWALFLFLFPLFLISAQEGIVLEWEGRENYTYQLELKKSDTTLFIHRLTETRFTLDLSPGEYTYRVTFFNKFDKPDAYSEWIDLKVLKSLTPLIIEVPEHTLFAKDREQKLEIITADIMDDAQIFLEKDKLTLSLPYRKTGENSLEIYIRTQSLEPGLYGLRIINPSGRETYSPEVIELREKIPPLVSDLSHKAAFLDDQIPRVHLRGDHFDKDMIAFLERKGHRYRLPVSEYISQQDVVLWLDLTGLEAGSYNLLLINPPLEEKLVTHAFTIIDPEKVRDTAYYEKIRWGTDLLIGFPLPDILLETPITNITYVDGEGLLGAIPEIETVLRLDFTRDNIFWKYFGGMIRAAFYPPFDTDYLITMNMGLYGRTRFSLPINLFMEGMLGYRWLSFDDDEDEIYEEGSLLTWGGGILINYDRFLLEGSLRRDFWLLKGDDELGLTQFTLRLGHRF